MTRYTNFKMRISDGQKDKLKKAFESNCESITIRLTFSDLYREDIVALTKSQVDRLVDAYEEQKGLTIRMSKTQISPQHENRRRIFTSVSWIDSIPNRNCFTRIRSWGFIRTGEHGSTKRNLKRIVSLEGWSCVSDWNWWRRAVSLTSKR